MKELILHFDILVLFYLLAFPSSKFGGNRLSGFLSTRYYNLNICKISKAVLYEAVSGVFSISACSRANVDNTFYRQRLFYTEILGVNASLLTQRFLQNFK